jgi:hypothetical protein
VSDLNRRELLGLLAASPLPAMLGLSPVAIERIRLGVAEAKEAEAQGTPYQTRFFTLAEWTTVRILADIIVPRDDRSGSATDAAVPEFMDFVLAEGSESQQVAIRGGLAWFERESRERHGRGFVQCSEAERIGLVELVAWPKKALPEMSQGVAFFNRFRDLVLSGFWSSKMGVEDLRYLGNTFVTEWTGCPPRVTGKLGVRS